MALLSTINTTAVSRDQPPVTLVLGRFYKIINSKIKLGSRRCGNLVLDTEQITIVAQFPEKGWTLLSESNL